jgi:hypothetical protein
MTLQNLPKFEFLVWKETIWQHCLARMKPLINFQHSPLL